MPAQANGLGIIVTFVSPRLTRSQRRRRFCGLSDRHENVAAVSSSSGRWLQVTRYAVAVGSGLNERLRRWIRDRQGGTGER